MNPTERNDRPGISFACLSMPEKTAVGITTELEGGVGPKQGDRDVLSGCFLPNVVATGTYEGALATITLYEIRRRRREKRTSRAHGYHQRLRSVQLLLSLWIIHG